MATSDDVWDQEKQEQFEQADASQDDAWFATNWPLHAHAMSDHVVESFPASQWKCFRKWLLTNEQQQHQQEVKEKLLDVLDQLERAEHLLEADEIQQEIQASLNNHPTTSTSPSTMMANLLSGPQLIKMMEHTSRGQAPPDPVPLPQLGPGEKFEMTMQMIKDENGVNTSAKMIPTIVKKNGKKYRMNPDGTASSDEIIE